MLLFPCFSCSFDFVKTASLKNGMDAIFQTGERARLQKLPFFVITKFLSCQEKPILNLFS